MKYLLNGEETDRLIFRLLTMDDREPWEQLFINEKVAEFVGLDPSRSPEELSKKWIEKAFYRYENDLGGLNALIDKETGEFVGQCGLLVQTVEGTERLEIGYSLIPKFWGRGYATEAAQKCRDHAFTNEFSETIISLIHPENESSAKVAVRNGMSIEKENVDFEGVIVNVYGISLGSWKKKYNPEALT